MARDYLRVVRQCEGYYKKCAGKSGGSNQDEDLRVLLVDFANTILDELNNYRAWRLDYVLGSLTTNLTPQAVYPRPTGLSYISNVYYVRTGGTPVEIHVGDPMQIRKTYGEFPQASIGPPLYYELQGNSIQFYPTPDATGPSAGAYTILFEGTSPVVHVVETTSNTAASTTLTVPSTGYLTDEGVTASGSAVSIRGAGNLAQQSIADTFVTSWSAFPSGTTVTLGAAPVQTAVVAAQTFFNSQNWIIQNFPNVLAFGMCREIATYLKDAYELWEQRYQAQLQLMEEYDAMSRQGIEQLAYALAGQLRVQYKDLDVPMIFDVRP